MSGWIKINYGNREEIFGADDLTIAALERGVRKRLADGLGFFITAPGEDPDSDTARMTLVVSPHAHVSFSYTDPADHLKMERTVEEVKRMIEQHGGVELDENDFLVDPS